MNRRVILFTSALFAAMAVGSAQPRRFAAGESAAGDWIELSDAKEFSAWRPERQGWLAAGEVAMDADHREQLEGRDGDGVIWSQGDAENLLSKEEFTDVELEIEFLLPNGSNSGVKLNGLYEIQMRDTHGLKEFDGDTCGGVYPRAKLGPPYEHIDHGVAPLENAARPAGEWQRLELTFVSPRFDSEGKKVANARFENVRLNGKVIHKAVDLRWPTGAAWNMSPETPRGPLLLQGDHGPVAFRKIRIRRLAE